MMSRACIAVLSIIATVAPAAERPSLAAGMTDHPAPPVARPAGPTAAEVGARLKSALLREAQHAGKPTWQPMLEHLAGMHAASVLPPVAHLPYPYESIGPGYQDGRVFGHIDLTHERLDVVRADPEHVRNQIRNELAGQQADGLVPGIVLFKPDGKASWKTAKGFPPIWVMAVDAYVAQTGDTAMLRECLEPLRRQIGWFEKNRSAPNGGFYYLDEKQDTWESGIDEGIRWDVRPKHLSAAVDASAHLYMLYDHAARWSHALGEPVAKWEHKADALRRFIRQELWDQDTGFFYDEWLLHDPANRHLAFEGMWPVVVGAATAEQARRVIDDHLLNPQEFFTPHPIATVAANDSKFELRMWRGPVWNCMTYWAARGCLQYGRGDAAHAIVEKALDSTALQFARTGTIWEFYDPFNGEQTALHRKPTMKGMPNMPHREYIGHNPLFAMADLWRQTSDRTEGARSAPVTPKTSQP